VNILMMNSKNQKPCLKGMIWSIRKFETIMIPILIRLFAITSEASKFLGSSSKLTIRLQEASCFVFRIFTSLSVKEKKAILDPETMKDMTSRNRMRITKMVVPCASINNKRMDREFGKNMLWEE